ncbi:unchacterized apicomplexan-specific serine rich low complexity [Cryptosporidium xiaoi]|uniref:Unchacterized apicomplexan-specific serine rich low complexity n=1 Tax=Cryptosporidium xiaoi TaxID=659607 RepID=A0AAV9XVV5_9CRYT
MDDSELGLNFGISGRKRHLSSDEEGNSDISQSQEIKTTVNNDINVSSKESTPRVLNKSSRSKRVLGSDSSSNGSLRDDNSVTTSELAVKNNMSSSSSDLNSDLASDSAGMNSDNESPETSSDDFPLRKRGNLIKKEKISPERCKTKKKIEKKNVNKNNHPAKKTEVTAYKGTSASSVKVKKEKMVSKKKKADSQDEFSSDEGETTAYVPRRDRDHKQILVAAILCRWWHALPDWPPPDTNYHELLKEKKFRLVNIDDWEDAPDVDENGYSKVFQLSNFPGVFRDFNGAAHDLRPIENKPCYSNLIKMDEDQLYKLLVTALENQIKTLENNSNDDSKLINELKKELVEAQTLLTRRNSKKK